jgi:hypothetical protein
MMIGAGWRDHGPVVASPTGEPWNPNSISQAFERAPRGPNVLAFTLDTYDHVLPGQQADAAAAAAALLNAP